VDANPPLSDLAAENFRDSTHIRDGDVTLTVVVAFNRRVRCRFLRSGDIPCQLLVS
jgi:hypothetical protein